MVTFRFYALVKGRRTPWSLKRFLRFFQHKRRNQKPNDVLLRRREDSQKVLRAPIHPGPWNIKHAKKGAIRLIWISLREFILAQKARSPSDGSASTNVAGHSTSNCESERSIGACAGPVGDTASDGHRNVQFGRRIENLPEMARWTHSFLCVSQTTREREDSWLYTASRNR